MTPAQLIEHIVIGCAAGDNVTVTRQTVMDLEWPHAKPVLAELADFLRVLRVDHCIAQGFGSGGYEFFKVRRG